MSLELGTICLQCIMLIIVLLAVFQGRRFMAGFAITFGIYIYLNLVAYYGWHFKIMSSVTPPLLLFIAAVTATYSLWQLYRD